MKGKLLVLLALAALAGVAAPGFEPVPDAARTALKGSRGRMFTAGLLFCNGAYVAPPYRVARYGTAIFVNDRQVTEQIVPWRQFLATQNGATPPPAPTPVAAAPKPVPVKETEGASLDDLFDDGGDAPAAAPTPAAASRPAAVPAESAASFTANARSEALLKRVNAARLDVQRRLKAGSMCFFGANYSRVIVEPRIAKDLLAVLPEAMRDAPDGAALSSTLRAKGFAFMPLALCEDLIRNRADYPQLRERRRALEEEATLHRMLQEAQ